MQLTVWCYGNKLTIIVPPSKQNYKKINAIKEIAVSNSFQANIIDKIIHKNKTKAAVVEIHISSKKKLETLEQ